MDLILNYSIDNKKPHFRRVIIKKDLSFLFLAVLVRRKYIITQKKLTSLQALFYKLTKYEIKESLSVSYPEGCSFIISPSYDLPKYAHFLTGIYPVHN